jgi:hypothetical protein
VREVREEAGIGITGLRPLPHPHHDDLIAAHQSEGVNR